MTSLRWRLGVCALVSSVTVSCAQEPLRTIAFGSCAREREPQPIWSEIIAEDPDLFLFIGDNQYADFWFKHGMLRMMPVEDVERIEEAYAELDRKPGFRRLRRHCPIMATWDDHDYGDNDAGREFPLREESQQAFLDFFGFGDDDPIREQEGIYHARIFGPEDQRVQVIMLDTRYHRDPLVRKVVRLPGTGPYKATEDTTRTILGEAQWAWLEEELGKDAEVRIIASSIQVVADEHGWETWGNFPHERRRLYDLIDDTDASGVVFVSGDRHLMEISRDAGELGHGDVAYPLWDFTSSGLTERPKYVDEPNAARVGPVMRETNFGVIEIHWHDEPERTRIDLVGRGDQGQMLTRQSVFLGELREDVQE